MDRLATARLARSWIVLVLSVIGPLACGNGGAGDDDGATDTDADTDTDSDTETDTDTTSDTGTGTDLPCDGDCAALTYSACTCDSGDPCHWSGDGYCDGYCVEGGVVGAGSWFDDSADCDGECSGLCLEVEWTIHYLPCTCAVDDPCEWATNGVCDETCLTEDVVAEMFDDFADCGQDAGLDAGADGG